MTDVTKNRHKFIGGSDVAAILGLNRYKTAYEVWEEKKHGIKTFTGNNFTDWGTKLEPVIVNHCQKEHNRPINRRNDRVISDVHSFIGCHPDGVMAGGPEVLIEAKTVSSMAFKHWANELPLEYYCQVQHNMFVCGLKKAYFICLVLDERNYFEIEVSFDADFVEKQNNYLVQWWNRYIIGDDVPLKILQDYEKENPEEKNIEADSLILDSITELKDLKAKIKELTEQKEVIETKIKEFIGSNTILSNGLTTLATWKPSVRVTVDSKKFKEEAPEIFIKYAKENISRTFLIKN